MYSVFDSYEISHCHGWQNLRACSHMTCFFDTGHVFDHFYSLFVHCMYSFCLGRHHFIVDLT